ncbi:MAG: LysM peptidoglycan-binding domain-containing protein [Candidatus Brocadiia bacterium]
MRKDAKIALCVILALMVLVVVIWGRSHRGTEDLALEASPDAEEPQVVAEAPEPATPPGPGTPSPPRGPEAAEPQPPDTEGPDARVAHARHEAPSTQVSDFSSYFPRDRAMINHVAVLTDEEEPEAPTEPTPEADAAPPAEPRREADTAPAPAPGPTVHTIVKGDTYRGLARKYYNDPDKWKVIYEANDIPPERLLIGLKLKIPALPGATARAPARREPPDDPVPATPARTYTVKRGDNFYTIARRLYRDPAKWRKLYQHNRDRLPDPSKPESLQAGTTIEVPLLAGAR